MSYTRRGGNKIAAARPFGSVGVVILSDRSLREALGAGRLVIDPLDESCIQPSSIDVKLSNLLPRVPQPHRRR